MAADKYWLIATINSRTTLPQLNAIVDAMPKKYVDGFGIPTRKDDLIEWIGERRLWHWNGTASKPQGRPSLCTISAADINSWLRTLPPPDLI